MTKKQANKRKIMKWEENYMTFDIKVLERKKYKEYRENNQMEIQGK